MNPSRLFSRRHVLSGCLGCLAAGRCAAQGTTLRAGEKADLTWQQVFDFAYGQSIPAMNRLAEQIGRDKFVALLQTAAGDATREDVSKIPVPVEKRDLALWVADLKKGSPLYDHALVYQIVKDTPSEFEVRVSQCLWAKTFRDAGAADIGYASICHPDLAAASAFHPKLRMTRTKTLMQGHDCCNLRYVFERS